MYIKARKNMTNVERVMAIISSSINKEYKKITLATSYVNHTNNIGTLLKGEILPSPRL